MLARLSRQELIEHARALGVPRPEVMTRDELTDEALRRAYGEGTEGRRARGWFGVARDLLAGLVEQGLHLPDAAKVIRGETAVNDAPRRPLATVTLAEIYAAQGHLERSLGVLEEVLEKEPEHEHARRSLEALRQRTAPSASEVELVTVPDAAEPVADSTLSELAAAEAPAAEPVADSTLSELAAAEAPELPSESPPAPADPFAAPSTAPLVAMSPVSPDSAVIFTQGPRVVLTWRLSQATFERCFARHPTGAPAARVVWWEPGAPARRIERETTLTQSEGELVLEAEGATAQAVVRGAIGWRAGDAFQLVAVAVVTALSEPAPVYRPHAAVQLGDLDARRSVAQSLASRYA